ncbi:MAG: hypothetical protein HYW10_00850 [Candidatus Omnitrophica bacterium]|nr:hypothetical protein [Candidatus Omnitrophota bacterium]
MAEKIGKVVAVYGPIVDVQFDMRACLPGLYEVLRLSSAEGQPLMLEVVEHRKAGVCRCIALGQTFGVQRHAPVEALGGPLHPFPLCRGFPSGMPPPWSRPSSWTASQARPPRSWKPASR